MKCNFGVAILRCARGRNHNGVRTRRAAVFMKPLDMGSPPHEKLTRREREIMDTLFALGEPASAEDVRERLTDPPGYSAVRAMLVRLEAKGFVRHREEGSRYVYFPTKSRASARRSAIDQLVRAFFGGSPRDTVTALLQRECWADEELRSLQAQIEQVRKEQGAQRRRS